MVNRIYVERDVIDHDRCKEIIGRYKGVPVVECDRYGEVFNPRSQNFRLQKQNPSLILARKHDKQVLPAPPGYGIGDDDGYYFSHMLNCPYDCRYCFLQGMYSSANHIVFVNYEDYVEAIDSVIASNSATSWFNSGYDCDSLAFDPMTGFVDYFVSAFAARPDATLELRTKSTQIRSLLKHEPVPNVVTAFSFSPESVHQALEHGVPSIVKRIEAANKLQQAGWPVGIRFEPLIYMEEFSPHYDGIIEAVLGSLDCDVLHSVSIGSFRMPNGFFDRIRKLYPEEPIYSGPLSRDERITGYKKEIEQSMSRYCRSRILEFVGENQFYECREAA